jgi:hypothetical protein
MLTDDRMTMKTEKTGMTDGSPEGTSSVGADASVIRLLPDGTKVKQRRLRMRACDEVNSKSKICAGHLKRWYRPTAMVREALGSDAELYRCERCHTIYLPNPAENARTRTLAW